MLDISLRVLLVYILLLISIRIMGKREIGQLSNLDFVVAIVVAELATLPITDHRLTLEETILPMLIITVLQVTVSLICLKSNRFRRLLYGRPNVLIAGGQMQMQEMQKARYNIDDLLSQLRQKDVFDIAMIEYAVLETSGELTVLLMLDISSSVNSAALTGKAVEAAALLGLSAIGNHDRVGLSLFSDRVEKFLIPRNGRHNNLRLIRELVAVADAPPSAGTNIALALRNACSVLVKRSVIFIVSDMLDDSPELETALRLASRRHDVIVLHLYDPDSWDLPAGLNNLYDAESGAFIRLNSRRARQQYQERCRVQTESAQNLCRRCGAEVIPLPGNVETVSALMSFFRQRRQHRRIRPAGSNNL